MINEQLPYYEIVAYEEWGNYQKHSFDLTDDCDVNDWADAEEQLKQRKWPHYDTTTLLLKMVELKYLPPCELLVDVYW